MTGRAVGGKFFDVGNGSDQACVAGAEQLVWTMTGGAGDRPRHCEDRGVQGGESLSIPGARR